LAIQDNATAEGQESPQDPRLTPGPKDDTPGRRRRRGRPHRPAPTQVAEPEPEAEPQPAPAQKSDLFNKVLAKPPVRKLAKDHGLDLAAITPTGQHGEVTRTDVQSVLDGAKPAARAPQAGAVGESETIKVTGVRKATAQ